MKLRNILGAVVFTLALALTAHAGVIVHRVENKA